MRSAAAFASARRTLLRLSPFALALALAACSTSSVPISSVDYRDAVSRERGPATGSYTVQRGDTIYGIARQLNVSVRLLIDANHLQPPFQVSLGQVLLLPGGGNYVVVKDDTLLGVAHKTGVPFSTLARINMLSPPYLLRVGQTLKLPAASGETTVATAAAPASDTGARPQPTAAPAAPAAPAAVAPPTPGPGRPAAGYNTLAERESKPTVIPPAPPPPPPASSSAEAHPAATPVAAIEPAPLPPPPPNSGRGFAWPVHGALLAEFGTTGKGQHNDGINIAVPRGTPVLAAQDGVVAYAGNELRGFGNLLLIKHADGWMTAYAHNDTLMVKRGDTVRRGQQIAKAGDSGGVGQTQLHFEVRQGTRAVDPMSVLGGKASPAASSIDSPDPG